MDQASAGQGLGFFCHGLNVTCAEGPASPLARLWEAIMGDFFSFFLLICTFQMFFNGHVFLL